jgi:hypothetical protein
VGQVALEAVRDTADVLASRGRITQVAAELAHDHIPADTGTARLVHLSMEVVRAVSEVAVGGSTSRVQVMIILA